MIDIEEQVIRFLRENFLAEDEVDALGATDSLTESGIVNSTGILELVSFLENHFNVVVPDEDIIPDNFDTLHNIVTYLTSLISSTEHDRVRTSRKSKTYLSKELQTARNKND